MCFGQLIERFTNDFKFALDGGLDQGVGLVLLQVQTCGEGLDGQCRLAHIPKKGPWVTLHRQFLCMR